MFRVGTRVWYFAGQSGFGKIRQSVVVKTTPQGFWVAKKHGPAARKWKIGKKVNRHTCQWSSNTTRRTGASEEEVLAKAERLRLRARWFWHRPC